MKENKNLYKSKKAPLREGPNFIKHLTQPSK